jgi:beta-lactamase superfamily II metal-dependent hydrolase
MGVRVRMYNTGFGDCFLLTFPAPDRPRKVLIDCGKHTLSKTGPKLSRIVERVLEDIEEPGGPRVDVLVATHRHQDHVQGFAAAKWQDVRVGEVWMPWTEDPVDPVARDICDRQSLRASRLQLGFGAMAMDAGEREYVLGYAGNNLTNAAAMRRLHEGFQGAPLRRFLPEKSEEKNHFQTSVLPGVEVHALGPSRDPDVLREMEPPEGESFFGAVEWAGRPAGERLAPFDRRFMLSRAEYEAQSQPLEEDFPESWEKHIAEVFDDPALELLARLEAAVNSTSLVLLFHVGNAWLLFPGDAQWGTWNRLLQHPVHSRLLENLTFYKIGHHGSHNATPLRFVERYIKDGVRVMLPYGKVDKWPSIPRTGLLTALAERNVALARCDQAPAAAAPCTAFVENGEVLFIDAEVPV